MPQENFHPKNPQRPSPGVLGNSALPPAAYQTLNFSGSGVPPVRPPAATRGRRCSSFARNLIVLIILCLSIGLVAAYPAPCQVIAGTAALKDLSLQMTQTASTPQPSGHPEDIPELLQKLLDHDPQTRAAASQSLRTIPPEIKIPALTYALLDPNWKIQVLAAHHLGQMGAAAQSAIPALTEALTNSNPDVRFTLAKALGKIGSAAAVPALAQALQDKDENVRMAAAQALDNLGPDAHAALPVLQKTLRDGNWFVRTHAASAFVRLAARDKSMLPVLLKALENPLEESPHRGTAYHFRRQAEIPAVVAIDALAERGPEAVHLDLLGTQLPDLDNVIVALVTIGSKSGNAKLVELLINLSNTVSASEIGYTLEVFGKIGFKIILGKVIDNYGYPKNVLPPLAAALRQKDWHRRAAAIAAIYQTYKISINAAMPYFRRALKDPDWRVRGTAVICLRESSHPLSREIVAVLAPALNDADWRVRLNAIRAIEFSDPTTKSLYLLHGTQDTNESIRLEAAIRLAESGNETELANTILTQVLQQHQDARSRLRAFDALNASPAGASSAAVLAALQDKDAGVRAAAAYAAGKAGDTAIPVLSRALRDEDARVRQAAVQALSEIGSPIAVTALFTALDDADKEVRWDAGHSLRQFKSTIQGIETQLRHSDWQERRRAAKKLEVIGFDYDKVSDPPVPALLKALQDQNPNVFASVAVALIRNYGDLPDTIANALEQSLPGVLDSLKQGDPQARLDSIYALSKLGQIARPAIPDLRYALADENWLIRYAAAITLIKINPQETAVVPVLAEIFRDPQKADLLLVGDDNLCPHNELDALGNLGSPEAVSALINLLQVGDEKMRYTNFLSQGSGEPEEWISPSLILAGVGPRAIPPLVVALQNENVRLLAAEILGRIGPQAIPPLMALLLPKDKVEPALKEILRDKDADLRRSAIYALGRIGREPSAQVKDFIAWWVSRMNDRTEPAKVRCMAAVYLMEMSQNVKFVFPKKDIIAKLDSVMHDGTEPAEVRWMAAVSLMKMGKNVKFPFKTLNLPKPVDDTCFFNEILHNRSYFDLYAGRCLFAGELTKGGGYELFQLVRGLLTEKASPGSTRPQSQPAPANR